MNLISTTVIKLNKICAGSSFIAWKNYSQQEQLYILCPALGQICHSLYDASVVLSSVLTHCLEVFDLKGLLFGNR
jgi:hypothetical protein